MTLLACNQAHTQPVHTLIDAEAVRGHWNDVAPPTTGWVPVTLMDHWNTRWPEHDGVVWYRLHWQQASNSAPAGLLLNYVCMASALYINGQLVGSDRSLVEPLTRAWIAPRYILLPKAILKQGSNTLLVRVSGLSAYQPGLGIISVGDPAQVEAMYRHEQLHRSDLQVLDTAIGAVLATLFGLFWLLRRQDTVYGWYAANGLFGLLYELNWIHNSPWPFATTDGWQAFIGGSYIAMAVCYMIFLLRFADRRWPRSERALLAVAGCIFILALLFPHWMGPHRDVYLLPMIFLHYLTSAGFMVWALRQGRIDQKVLGLCIALPLLTALHDAGVYLELINADAFVGSFASPLMLLGMGFVLAYRFTRTMRRVEGFNAELQHEVNCATTQLADTLGQQHALALAHSRAGERLQLVRDLHDGFGGTLVGTITHLQQTASNTPKAQLIDILKDMRDDLRLVVDTTTQEQSDLATLIAPMRHRASRLLEAAEIDAHWQMDGLDGVQLEPARSLDLLRLLQEALTNVFKHSRASRVDVHISQNGGRLKLRIFDDGIGLAPAPAPAPASSLTARGTGLASMRLRAQRLGGHLELQPRAPGIELRLEFPLVL